MIVTCQLAAAQTIPGRLNISLKDKQTIFVKIDVRDAMSVRTEGYDGDQLIIEPDTSMPDSLSKAAAGLHDITGFCTILGPALSGEKPLIRNGPGLIDIIWQCHDNKYLLVRIPRNTHLSLAFWALTSGTKMSVKNLAGVIELGGNPASLDVSDVTGPLVLNLHGMPDTARDRLNITHVSWHEMVNEKSPVYIITLSQDVDLSLPASSRATINVAATNGNLYSNFDLVGVKPFFAERKSFTGEINGGGTPIYIRMAYGNVFIRKQN